jgi:hypothetical protein
MRKSMVLGLFLLLAGTASRANDIYIAQSTTGGGNGSDCSNTLPASWFNSSSSWGTSASQIGPGTTVHLCGTIGIALTAQGGGASGNPVTIHFESGAKLSQPAAAGDFLNLGGNSHFVVDGNSVGFIENTANGSALTNQVNGAVGVNYSGSSDVEIKNLTIQNLYVHVQNSSESIDQTTTNCTKGGSGSTIKIHDNVMHDVGWCVYTINGPADNDVEIYHNLIFRVDHGIAITAASTGMSLSSLTIHDNHIYNYANWDNGGSFHHDGIHMYGQGTSSVNGFQLYNNLFEGPVGTSITAHLFMEHGGSDAHISNFSIYNNVAVTDDNSNLNNGLFGIFSGDSGTNQVYNNTFVGATNASGLCLGVQYIAGLKLKNNVITSCNQIINFSSNAYSAGDVDYNIYANIGGNGNAFLYNGTFYGSLAAWQTAALADTHGKNVSSASLNSSGVPLAVSPVIGAGTNLTSIGIAALDRDKLGRLRPASGAWDSGAYTSGTVTNQVVPPTALVATIN